MPAIGTNARAPRPSAVPAATTVVVNRPSLLICSTYPKWGGHSPFLTAHGRPTGPAVPLCVGVNAVRSCSVSRNSPPSAARSKRRRSSLERGTWRYGWFGRPDLPRRAGGPAALLVAHGDVLGQTGQG